MPGDLANLEVLGVHPVEPSKRLSEETLELQWGPALSGADLENARASVREHFEGLYLLEVRVDPHDATVDWSGITQPVPGSPRTNWQVPYDERCVSEVEGRWAFFFHYLRIDQPIETPVGPRSLPRPTVYPPHLAGIDYEAP